MQCIRTPSFRRPRALSCSLEARIVGLPFEVLQIVWAVLRFMYLLVVLVISYLPDGNATSWRRTVTGRYVNTDVPIRSMQTLFWKHYFRRCSAMAGLHGFWDNFQEEKMNSFCHWNRQKLVETPSKTQDVFELKYFNIYGSIVFLH